MILEVVFERRVRLAYLVERGILRVVTVGMTVKAMIYKMLNRNITKREIAKGAATMLMNFAIPTTELTERVALVTKENTGMSKLSERIFVRP